MRGKPEANTETIQVVVRCRPKNSNETNSPVIVGCNKSSVDIKQTIGDKQQTKTFNFDKVFSPQSTQVEVYQSVVQPMLEKVVDGYNCTIFAYGQTGTGKTHTMEGNIEATASEFSALDDSSAGIIPRTLHQLFEMLDAQQNEYSVRVSFIELYNEELRDLLASPAALATTGDRLRIFEDSARKGAVVVQGAEETIVHNHREVHALMQKGASVRATAATKMNQQSSRSHSVFCVTVHVKESTTDGEELLKIGKLNLVDLAGSENIGRSGARDARAREAGNINQSLLTLGRVISSLVEHSPHVPYRESKLTRLLQDSLGGSTKTCIIATISPAQNNLEETLSTLDYAYRAKNIKNRPEVNQKLTKRALIGEYVAEVERLKRDLAAAREKNGIFLSKDNFDEMETTLATQKSRIDELVAELAGVASEMEKVQALFVKAERDLKDTRVTLQTTQVALDEKAQQLEVTKVELKQTTVEREEQRSVAQEHAQTEVMLQKQASELLSTVRESTADIDALHGKIARKAAVESRNRTVAEQFRDSVHTSMEVLGQSMSEYAEAQATQARATATLLSEFAARAESAYGSLVSVLAETDTQAQSATGALDTLTAECVAERNEHLRTSVAQASQAHCAATETAIRGFLRDTHTPHMATLARLAADQVEAVRQLTSLMQTHIASSSAAMSSFAQEHTSRLAALDATVVTATTTISQRIEHQQATAAAQAEHERQTNAAMHVNAIEQISKVLQGLQSHQMASLDRSQHALRVASAETTEAVSHLSARVSTTVSHAQQSIQQHEASHQSLQAASTNSLSSFAESTTQNTSSVEQTHTALSSATDAVFASLASVTKQHSGNVVAAVDANSAALDSHMHKHRTATHEASKTLSDALKGVSGTIQEREHAVDTLCESADGIFTEMQRLSLDQRQSALKSKETLKQETDVFVADKLAVDVPTGATPLKDRAYPHPTEFAKTRAHQLIITDLHAKLMNLEQGGENDDEDEKDKEETSPSRKENSAESTATSVAPSKSRLPTTRTTKVPLRTLSSNCK